MEIRGELGGEVGGELELEVERELERELEGMPTPLYRPMTLLPLNCGADHRPGRACVSNVKLEQW